MTLASGEVEIRAVETKSLWDQIFIVVDWGFLTAFVIELILKLYAWGPVTYLKNCLDAFDAAVVTISYGFVIVFTSGIMDTCSAGSNAATIAALKNAPSVPAPRAVTRSAGNARRAPRRPHCLVTDRVPMV